ncbi:hypothetical protein ACMXYR_04125 [Neptuniibacter sp. QD29_5]|uniref:hypothetical protein n=1 Tax=Neptuniibacter sp. QD29_5 TaxID=3398207 RepID=UPI0039F48FAB
MLALHRHSAIETVYARVLRQNLQQFTICSTQSDAGNTSLALAVATRAAKAGKRVLLIELNPSSPQLVTWLSLKNTEWLPLTGHWEHAAQETDVPGLMVLNCPVQSSHCVEFRDLETLKLFFNSCLNLFDMVICDSAPVLTEKSQLQNDNHLPVDIICSASKATLLNIVTGRTTESQVDEARETLKNSGAILAGVIMNDRFAPSLQQELIRETYRFEKRFPKLMRYFRERFSHMTLLNQEL